MIQAAIAASDAAVPVASTAATVRVPGAVITGAVWSVTLTSELAAPKLPDESVALKVTVVTPGKKTLLALLEIVIELSTLSRPDAPFK